MRQNKLKGEKLKEKKNTKNKTQTTQEIKIGNNKRFKTCKNATNNCPSQIMKNLASHN